MAVVERVGERADHGVHGHRVLHPLAPAQIGKPVRGAAHRLGAAGHSRVGVTEHDGLGGGDDGLQPAAAEPVHGQRGRADRQAAVDGGHPPQVHVPGLGVDHVAEHGVAHVRGIHLGPGHRVAHHRGGEVAGRHGRQTAAVFADSGPHRGQDQDIRLVKRVIHCRSLR